MSKTYLRIYCNGHKVRSTGSEKWYRKMILHNFMLDENLKAYLPANNVDDRYTRLSNALKACAFHGGHADKFIVSIHLMRSNSKGKTTLNEIVLPWVLRQDGRITVLEDWERRQYEFKNPGIFRFSQIKFHTPGYCEESLQETNDTD